MDRKKEILIRNMVCSRCIKVINGEFKKLGIDIHDIQMGKAIVSFDSDIDQGKVEDVLKKDGFEIIHDRESLIAEKIRLLLIERIREEIKMDKNLPDYLSGKLAVNYNKLSKVFSKSFGKTIERYWITLKIERAKEFIEYGELSLGEIAYKLGYATPQSLSKQFRNETGMSMEEYRKLGLHERKSLDII